MNYKQWEKERSIKMNFDDFIENVLNLSETKPVYCPDFQYDNCKGGCNLIHIKLRTAVVCKHWLKGMCKKNEKCTFLHDFDLKKIPECFFFNVYGVCNNHDCFYRHVNRDCIINECKNYTNNGFCWEGPDCKNKHIKKTLCLQYVNGFCIEGRECPRVHLNVRTV